MPARAATTARVHEEPQGRQDRQDRPGQQDRSFRSLPFVWGSLAAALVPGFGMGAVLFGAILSGYPVGPSWVAAAQAHGHAQVFGFAGLMVWGVGFYFLPRLRGAPLAAPHLLPPVLAVYGGGVLLRVVGQQVGPLLAPTGGAGTALAALALALSGPLELAGATVALALLGWTAGQGPPLRSRAGVMQVLPLMIAAWVGLWLALLVNAVGTVVAGWRTLQTAASAAAVPWLVPTGLDAVAIRLALLAWLVPLAVAFAARNFPLFLRTPTVPARHLRWGLALLVDGLAADLLGRLLPGGWGPAEAAGAALEGLALLWFTYAVGALGRKVTLPGRHVELEEARLAEVSRWPLSGAFVWLVVAAVLLLLEAGSVWDLWPAPPEDAQRHALGAGFLTLLIVGMGLRLLPGFAGAQRRRVALSAAGWAIGLAHVAALLRVGPPLVVWIVSAAGVSIEGATRIAVGAEAAAGVTGVLAIVAFAVALRVPLQPQATLRG